VNGLSIHSVGVFPTVEARFVHVITRLRARCAVEAPVGLAVLAAVALEAAPTHAGTRMPMQLWTMQLWTLS
jgi:hypothetical protein